MGCFCLFIHGTDEMGGAVPGKKELSLLNYKETFKKLNVYNLAGNQETI